MKIQLLAAALLLTFLGCSEKKTEEKTAETSTIAGTWSLVSSKVIAKGDTTITFPVKGQEMIKMFTDKDFAFFKHDVNQGKQDPAVFDAGSGTYTLNGDNYAEHLAYCNYRDWENRDFSFKLHVRNDTMIQSGIEKIDSLNIDQEILEIYVKKR